MNTNVVQVTITYINSEWTEVNNRFFSNEEKSAVIAVTVVASKYGKSAAFVFPNGRKFIPLEPNTTANVGDVLDINTIKLVELKYTGSNEEQENTSILRVRVETPKEEQSFNNPFGL